MIYWKIINPFHPGITLKEKLNELGIKPKQFARQIGIPKKQLLKIIVGKKSIEDIAFLLDEYLKIPTHWWINSQKRFDNYQLIQYINKLRKNV